MYRRSTTPFGRPPVVTDSNDDKPYRSLTDTPDNPHMSCYEIEALRLALMNVFGIADESARQHAEQELEGELSGPIEALANADDLAEVQRHLDAALVDLEEQIAETDEDAADYDYLRGRLVAVRDAEMSLRRISDSADAFLDDLGESHHVLHEAFPADE
jgi:hypothetical protein